MRALSSVPAASVLANFGCDTVPPPPHPIVTPLAPLASLSFLECDIDEVGLDMFLARRRTRALSITHRRHLQNPIRRGPDEAPACVPTINRTVETLETLRLPHTFGNPLDPMRLDELTGLRVLQTDAHDFLVLHRRHRSQPEEYLPPNVEVIALDFSYSREKKNKRSLAAAVDCKEMGFTPKLRRVEIVPDRSRLDLRSDDTYGAVRRKGIELGCRPLHANEEPREVY